MQNIYRTFGFFREQRIWWFSHKRHSVFNIGSNTVFHSTTSLG